MCWGQSHQTPERSNLHLCRRPHQETGTVLDQLCPRSARHKTPGLRRCWAASVCTVT
ncbi:rCG56004 [Rattus norvegicus]|uniref:RCG56004 n=1 Tax=Rattus norvegicus TaxID=10116 RepID=A6IB35_RAT|nr:rCG56004 [Rattus norvegicus]